jgi:uroporphyrinogen-III synthase
MADRAAQAGISLSHPEGLGVAAIGEATAEAARTAGFHVTFVPESYVAESLAHGLAAQSVGKRILLLRAAVARDVIPDALRKSGASVDVVDAYRNVMPESAPPLLRSALSRGVDAVTFTSSSGVLHLSYAAQAAGIAWPFAGVAAVSIGPITSRTLRESGWEPAVEANPSDVEGLIAALRRLWDSGAGGIPEKLNKNKRECL